MAAERSEGWTGQVAMLLTAFFPATGLRPSELRLANLEDLELRNWTFRVRHPKGERSYGRQRMVLVLPPAHEAAKRFLKERRMKLDEMGVNACEVLIPAFHGRGKAGFYASARFWEIKRKVQRLVNVDPGGEKIDFHIKTFRNTYCQDVHRPGREQALRNIRDHGTRDHQDYRGALWAHERDEGARASEGAMGRGDPA
ncbi:MAG: site-specific integrase [Methanomassiliicoccales archaeon]|nr:site-specific integrase [Methanomassiliicoccales archaeon]